MQEAPPATLEALLRRGEALREHVLQVEHASGLKDDGAAVAAFITSGMIGLSLGPIYFSTLADRLGLGSMSVAAVPALVVAAFLVWRLPSPAASDAGIKRSLEQQATIVPRDGAYGLLEAFSKRGSKLLLLLLLLLAPAEEGCHSSRLRRC